MSGSRPDLGELMADLDRGRISAEELLTAAVAAAADVPATARRDWWRFLDRTRMPDFLTALPDDETRGRWADLCFRLVEETDFQLGDLLDQRVATQPDHPLFRELVGSGAQKSGESWSYSRVARRLRETAAVLLREGGGDTEHPLRVAIFSANSLGSACVDLACLTHGIFITPLDIHLGTENLEWILRRVGVTAAYCDNRDRLEKLLAIRQRKNLDLRIFVPSDDLVRGTDDVVVLDARRAALSHDEIDDTLSARPRPTPRDPATVMFTSGSTGRPKGVLFNQFNLVTKRFGRGAALPTVGRAEVMLCYLPLYHTFGRYLEMLGTIYWGGTYVFAGNPSADTFLAQLVDVRPTGMISVPVRWVQVRDRVVGRTGEAGSSRDFRQVVGDRLSWGLSAAGWLDPRVFRFFHRHGVALCSGFGMTEGTGGLTMTPPNDYVEGSVGIPLPGTKVRFADEGELQIAGQYIARYLPEDGASGDLRVDEPASDDFWLATGDIFRHTRGEHLEIVDRVKDIYKNNRGQTIAPRKVESLFTGVPGLKNTFLAGDGRGYNTLLIVPDETDPVLVEQSDDEARREYFERIVTAANPGLASYERVVDFAILERDFHIDHGELTPKGSFRRKVIERNFADVIASMYQTNVRELEVGGRTVRIPRWFTRDLGVLDDAIEIGPDGLVNRDSGVQLTIADGADGRVWIGDLEYRLAGDVVDLGLLVRQPLLWLGNPQLVRFGPCRTGWDTSLGPYGEQVVLTPAPSPGADAAGPPAGIDRGLAEIDGLCRVALFGPAERSLEAIAELDDRLGHVGARLGGVIRRRLEALAHHPNQTVRCRAYQVLVLDQPVPDYQRYLPAFIESGLPFLDDESFGAISRALIEPRRLQALRQRLHSYREHLDWPAPPRTRRLFRDIFRLLADFARTQPEFYGPVREELVSWILHEGDPALRDDAAGEFDALSLWFEERLTEGADTDADEWGERVVFQEGLGEVEVQRLREVLVGTTFLRQSVLLCFEGEVLRRRDVGPGGIWVSRIISRFEDSRYRVSINTRQGKHFDLQLIVRQDIDRALVRDTIYWYIALRGYPFGTAMLPKFGCCRPKLGVLSMTYVSDLTVWEKVREFSSVRGPGTTPPSRMRWRQLLVRAMTVVVKGWRNSGRRIIPGLVTPNNIVVPEPDYRRGAVQNNLTGWLPYTSPLSLIRPIWRNIYQHTISHYPWTREYLESSWIFDAVVEALGRDEALAWLRQLQQEVRTTTAHEVGPGFEETLDTFVEDLARRFQPPLALRGAIRRYGDWERVNARATVDARLEVLAELQRLYRLTDSPEIVRFHLFRHTLFRDAAPDLADVFERLLTRMFRQPERPATLMVELSELQAALTTPEDRRVFQRLAFPGRTADERVEVQTVGDPERERVVVKSRVTDRMGESFSIGEPAGPADVGHLYRTFLQAGFPRSVGEADRYFVLTDEMEQIIGGIIWREHVEATVFLEGIVVARTLVERGLVAAMLEDFCTRMRAVGKLHVKTHFFLRHFYERHGFRVDPRWGGLVRRL
ncbi:MAG: AMP-binding protein [bacterium]|nr:AMP-binding protein [bacterium]